MTDPLDLDALELNGACPHESESFLCNDCAETLIAQLREARQGWDAETVQRQVADFNALADAARGYKAEVARLTNRVQELTENLEEFRESDQLNYERAQKAEADVARLTEQGDALRTLMVSARPWFVCDATCLDCEEQLPCPTQQMLARIDAALARTAPKPEKQRHPSSPQSKGFKGVKTPRKFLKDSGQ